MCGKCLVGPEVWRCSACGITNAVRFHVKCSRCGHPLVGQTFTVPVLGQKKQGQGGK